MQEKALHVRLTSDSVSEIYQSIMRNIIVKCECTPHNYHYRKYILRNTVCKTKNIGGKPENPFQLSPQNHC